MRLALHLSWAAMLTLATTALATGPAPAGKLPGAALPVAQDTSLVARLAGTWRLDVPASDLGKSPRVPKWREDRITRDGDWIAVRSSSIRSSGDTLRLDFRYHTAGESTNRVSGQDVRTRGRREGGGLALESEAQLALFKFEVSERWSLSADGTTLTQARNSRSPLGEERTRLVYRRQR